MMFLFYFFGTTAVLSALSVVFTYNSMYVLLYLVNFFISISCISFVLGAFFIGAIEIIVYVSAVMVLFIFMVMMLNSEEVFFDNEWKYNCLSATSYWSIFFLAFVMFLVLSSLLLKTEDSVIDVSVMYLIDIKKISIALFGPYILAIEIASFLLLGSLISILHISKEYMYFDSFSCKKLEEYNKQ